VARRAGTSQDAKGWVWSPSDNCMAFLERASESACRPESIYGYARNPCLIAQYRRLPISTLVERKRPPRTLWGETAPTDVDWRCGAAYLTGFDRQTAGTHARSVGVWVTEGAYRWAQREAYGTGEPDKAATTLVVVREVQPVCLIRGGAAVVV